MHDPTRDTCLLTGFSPSFVEALDSLPIPLKNEWAYYPFSFEIICFSLLL